MFQGPGVAWNVGDNVFEGSGVARSVETTCLRDVVLPGVYGQHVSGMWCCPEYCSVVYCVVYWTTCFRDLVLPGV